MCAVPHSSKCDLYIMKSEKFNVCYHSKVAHLIAAIWSCGTFMSKVCPIVLMQMCLIFIVFVVVCCWSAEHQIQARSKLSYRLYIANHAM
jgi:hypothetical protein